MFLFTTTRLLSFRKKLPYILAGEGYSESKLLLLKFWRERYSHLTWISDVDNFAGIDAESGLFFFFIRCWLNRQLILPWGQCSFCCRRTNRWGGIRIMLFSWSFWQSTPYRFLGVQSCSWKNTNLLAFSEDVWTFLLGPLEPIALKLISLNLFER
jgi:hypothetical protein